MQITTHDQIIRSLHNQTSVVVASFEGIAVVGIALVGIVDTAAVVVVTAVVAAAAVVNVAAAVVVTGVVAAGTVLVVDERAVGEFPAAAVHVGQDTSMGRNASHCK